MYFLTSGTSFAEAPRFRICYGSVAHVFAFTPCHLISVPAFGRSIFGNFVRIAEQLNEEITSGAFTLPFHQWLQLLRITGWGKKSWRYFFEGCSEAKHDILQATRFDAFKSCLNWDMVAGVLAGRVHIDPSGKNLCRSFPYLNTPLLISYSPHFSASVVPGECQCRNDGHRRQCRCLCPIWGLVAQEKLLTPMVLSCPGWMEGAYQN